MERWGWGKFRWGGLWGRGLIKNSEDFNLKRAVEWDKTARFRFIAPCL